MVCAYCVIVFVYFQNLCPGLLPDPLFPDEYNLGDIYLGVEFICQQCQERKEDLYSVLTVSYGICNAQGAGIQ